MSNLNISQFPAASSADNTADLLLLWQGGTSTTKSIGKLNYLGLSSVPVGINDSQTLTNKVLTAPTISSPVLSGTITGTYTIGGTPTFPASVVTLTGSQTLTNKILTSPTINSPTITNATISTDTITGYSVSTNVTVGGVTLQNGAVGGTTGTFSGAVSGTTGTFSSLLTASNGFTLSGGTLTLPNHSVTSAMVQSVQARQGGTTGSASWATAGTSNSSLTSTTVNIQVGSVTSSASGVVTVTFPNAFTQIPLIFVSVQAASNGFWAEIDSGTLSTTQFGVTCWSTTSNLVAKTVYWLAIGQ